MALAFVFYGLVQEFSSVRFLPVNMLATEFLFHGFLLRRPLHLTYLLNFSARNSPFDWLLP
jgi:hypothetical protein